MSKNNIEKIFTEDIDNYINDNHEFESIQSQEYKELLELGRNLADRDFSSESNKRKVFKTISNNTNKYKGDNIMNRLKKTKQPVAKVASFIMVCVLSISLVQTSFAQDFIEKVKKIVKLDYIEVVEEDYSEIRKGQMPEFFDKDGNPLNNLDISEQIDSNYKVSVYTADGEEIVLVGNSYESDNLIVKDVDKLNGYTCFDVILPEYIPEGYTFDRAEFYRDENGVVENSKYISLYFTNNETSEYIFMQQRFADEETAYAAGGEKVEKIQVNGVDAILYDNSLDWELNGVIYALTAHGLSESQLINIAESIK